MREEIRALIGEVYVAELGGIVVEDDLNLFESGIIDSFALTTLVAALETKYGLRIPDSDATPDNLGSVALVESYLKGRLG